MEQLFCRLFCAVFWINLFDRGINHIETAVLASGSECKITMLGQEYSGMVNITRSGRTCQPWELDSPHKHKFNYLSYEENFCRNPDQEPEGPWCYTTDPGVRWEYCDVPFCGTTAPLKTSGGSTAVDNWLSTGGTINTSTASSAVSFPTTIGTQQTLPTESTTNVSTSTCFCPCNLVSNKIVGIQELQEIIAELKEQLHVDKTQTSKYVRRRISARDKRLSSRMMGSVAVILLVVVAVFIFLIDCNNLFKIRHENGH